MTSDELTKISTRLLLATLAIPIPPNRSVIDECLDQDDITQEKLKRLSSLLGLQQPPTRLSLIKVCIYFLFRILFICVNYYGYYSSLIILFNLINIYGHLEEMIYIEKLCVKS